MMLAIAFFLFAVAGVYFGYHWGFTDGYVTGWRRRGELQKEFDKDSENRFNKMKEGE